MLLEWQRSLGPLGVPDYLRDVWVDEFRAGGVDVQVVPVYLEPEVAEAGLRKTLLAIEHLRAEIEKAPDALALCTSSGEIDAALAAGKVAILIALEGIQSLGSDVELLASFHRLGVRMVSFTHLGRTLLADGSGEDDRGARLTRAGVAAVRELERLGVLIDVSHLASAAAEHVLELASGPVIASHSSARAVRDHHRNLSDTLLRAIAASGGVIGVNFLPAFVDPDLPTIDRVVDHVAHIASVAGIEHVGLGPDFVKDYFDAVYPQFPELPLIEGIDMKRGIDGLERTRDLPRLTERLLARRFAEDDVRKILGENFLRVFREVLN
jgi:membrane dipeptidase